MLSLPSSYSTGRQKPVHDEEGDPPEDEEPDDDGRFDRQLRTCDDLGGEDENCSSIIITLNGPTTKNGGRLADGLPVPPV